MTAIQESFDFLTERELSYEEVSGTVAGIIFENPETGWKVIEVASGKGREKIAGYLPNIGEGDSLTARCTVLEHDRFGKCLQVDEFEKVLPFSREGVMRFLVAMIPGVGETLAGRIVERFGERTLEILDGEPSRLAEVEGMSPEKALKVGKAAAGVDSTMRELVLLGFTPKWASRIFLEYGAEAAERVKKRPYRLIRDFKGIGFKKADLIARAAGIGKVDDERISAGLAFTLKTEMGKTGAVYMELSRLARAASILLELPRNYILGSILTDPGLVVEGERVYLPRYHAAEVHVAEMISARVKEDRGDEIPDLSSLMGEAGIDGKITFTDEQREAIEGAIRNSMTVITGAAGTGKSTICRGLCALLDKLGKTYLLAAPTGRAAERLGEAAGRPAATIHRTLKYRPGTGFRVNAEAPLDTDYLIVDEASMIDLLLLDGLLEGTSERTRLVFIGDPYQLPPVEAGEALRPLIASYSVEQVVLPRIFRQEKGSGILEAAGMVNLERPFPMDETPGFRFVDTDDPVRMIREMNAAFDRFISEGRDPIKDVHTLTPLNKAGGEISVSSLNLRLRERFNPPARLRTRAIFSREFRIGDKVMQRRNNYNLDIFNGDIGFITSFGEEDSIEVDFSGRIVSIPARDTEDLVLAYAMTVHKAQGAEAPCVIFLATRAGAYFLLNRNLFYTAMTRAREHLVMIMPYDALKTALRRKLDRRSALPERIRSKVIGREKSGGGGKGE